LRRSAGWEEASVATGSSDPVTAATAVLGPAGRGFDRGRHGIERFFGQFTSDDRVVAQRARNLAVFVAVVIVGYHYSLSTLFRTLQSDTPLAYLGLVPVMALGLAAVLARPNPAEPPIHDRQLDYIIGIPLLVASLAINIVLPVRLSSLFWIWRVDLLALPLFVAGTIALLFGVRTLWRGRIPILFLFLAWPLPYTSFLANQLQSFTNVTVTAVKAALAVVPVAHSIPSSDGTLFAIKHGSTTFPVSVASACSGVNGVVGYGLVAIAFLAVVKGSLIRKAAWLLSGLVLVWLLNVVRIIAIFAAGHRWGEKVAIDGLHPFLGLVTFSLSVLIMLLLLGRFGLSFGARGPKRTAPSEPDAGATPPPRRPPAVPRTGIAVAIVSVLAVLSGIVNTSLQSFDLVATSVGTPRLDAFLTHPSRPDGWNVFKVAQFDWARQFFGSDSTWWRYDYHWDGSSTTQFHTFSTIIADVISTSDLASFSSYGIEACYNFHGYKLDAVNTVDLGGVVAHVVGYQNEFHSQWINVYWINPVNTPTGTRYERVNLMMINAAKSDTPAHVPSPSVARSLGIQIQDALTGATASAGPKLDHTRAFLAAFAANLVHHQQPAPATQ
jgi:exosortase